MGTRNVNLTERFDHFIDEEIAQGRFHNASEVVRAGLALLEKQSAEDALKLAALKRFTQERFALLNTGGGLRIQDEAELDALFDAMEARSARDAG